MNPKAEAFPTNDMPVDPKLLQVLLEIGELFPDITAIKLFGSRANGVPKDDSDTDVMFFLRSSSPEEYRLLEAMLTNPVKQIIQDAGFRAIKARGSDVVDVNFIRDIILFQEVEFLSSFAGIAMSGVTIYQRENES